MPQIMLNKAKLQLSEMMHGLKHACASKPCKEDCKINSQWHSCVSACASVKLIVFQVVRPSSCCGSLWDFLESPELSPNVLETHTLG
jgi:hypothetical protein